MDFRCSESDAFKRRFLGEDLVGIISRVASFLQSEPKCRRLFWPASKGYSRGTRLKVPRLIPRLVPQRFIRSAIKNFSTTSQSCHICECFFKTQEAFKTRRHSVEAERTKNVLNVSTVIVLTNSPNDRLLYEKKESFIVHNDHYIDTMRKK